MSGAKGWLGAISSASPSHPLTRSRSVCAIWRNNKRRAVVRGQFFNKSAPREQQVAATTAAVAAECGCNRSHIIIFISAPAATRRAQKQPPNRAARGNISPRVWRRHKAETRARVNTHSLRCGVLNAHPSPICMVTHTAHVKLAVQILFFARFLYLLLGVGRRAFQGQRGQRRGHGLLGTLFRRVLHLLLHVRLIVEHTP